MYKRQLSIFLLSVAGFFYGGCITFADAQHRIVVIKSADKPLHQSVENAFIETLSEKKDYTIITGSLENLPDERIINESDLLVSIGTRASIFLRNNFSHRKTLSAFIPESSFHQLWRGRKQAWAAVIDRPIDEHLRLIRRIMPDARDIGIIINDKNTYYSKLIRKAAKKQRMNPVIEIISDSRQVSRAIRKLSRKSHAILLVPDNVAITPHTAKWLLYSSYQKRIPVFAYSRQLTDAGAVASVYTRPRDTGTQAARLATEILDNKRIPFISYSKERVTAYNRPVARSLGIEITEQK